MTVLEKINEGIKNAMRQREQLRLEVLRMLKSKILAVNARGDVPDADVIKLFKTYHGNLQEALEHAKNAKRDDMIEKLNEELRIVEEFLPKAPSLEETKKLVMQAISESGAKSKKDFGLVMKMVLKMNSAVDGKLVKDLANQYLED